MNTSNTPLASFSDSNLNRRDFLKCAPTGAAILAAGTLKLRAAGANDRISIGVLGTGNRGQQLMRELFALSEKHNVQVTALCDVWRKNLESAAARLKSHSGSEPKQFTRYGDLLALNDLDAVVIATPDFSHAPILLAALKAGKDVYIEKPMTIDIPSANEAVDLARAKGYVVQVGTQHRSEGRYHAGAKLISKGALGKISRVSAAMNFNQARWARKYDDCKEEDVDWSAFLLHLRKRPFDARMFRQWQLHRDCTNGIAGLWMSHYADAIHLLTGAAYPSRGVSLGGIYVWRDGRDHTDTFQTLLEYPEGFLFSWAMGLANSAGVHFTIHGTKATFDVEARTVSSAGGQNSDLETTRIEDEPNQSHMGDWLECMRTRGATNATIEHGHQHVVATVMAATALETGTRQKYDPVKRVMTAA